MSFHTKILEPKTCFNIAVLQLDNEVSKVFTTRQPSLLLICCAEHCIGYDSVCLPIHLPQTGIMSTCFKLRSCGQRSSAEDSPVTLISSWITSTRNTKGNIGSGGDE